MDHASRSSTFTPSTGLLDRIASGAQRHWLAALTLALGLWVMLPFTAPVFMKANMPWAAGLVYSFYSFQCHQLPERSYFLFGTQLTYSMDAINAARGSDSTNLWALRQFIGNDQMGYKVAWSDRMVSLYTSIFLGAVVFALLRKRVRPLPILIVVLLLAPIGVDVLTHMVSDFAGLGQGFRDTNDWLRALTGNQFASEFYVGDGWGSFNSLMRIVTGVLAGLAVAWALLPRVDGIFSPRSSSQ